MKRSMWFQLSLVLLVLIAAPAFGEAPEAQCPAAETVDSQPLDEALFLDDGSGGSQCDEVSGCGFKPKRMFGDKDEFCASNCPAPGCHPGYESGYYDESSGCCICVAI